MTKYRHSARLFLFACLIAGSPLIAQSLRTLLSRFQSEQDRAAKEIVLNDITNGYPDAGPSLLRLASKTRDAETCWLAIRGIGWLKYKSAAPFLKQSLVSKSNYVRANAARSLGELKEVSATADLVRLLNRERDSGVIEQTALALQMLHAHAAVPALKARSSNPSAQTRLWVLGAIETLESKPELVFFAGFLADNDQNVAAYAARALERMTGQDFGFPKCGSGPCGYGEGVRNAQRWWHDHRQEW